MALGAADTVDRCMLFVLDITVTVGEGEILAGGELLSQSSSINE
jgi:hypothetical protein